MITATEKILRRARQGRYAVGAFNVYTLEAARTAIVPLSVHLGHCSSPERIEMALDAGISSVPTTIQ
jgi:fructose/tagatose bisphosphate aldolase